MKNVKIQDFATNEVFEVVQCNGLEELISVLDEREDCFMYRCQIREFLSRVKLSGKKRALFYDVYFYIGSYDSFGQVYCGRTSFPTTLEKEIREIEQTINVLLGISVIYKGWVYPITLGSYENVDKGMECEFILCIPAALFGKNATINIRKEPINNLQNPKL